MNHLRSKFTHWKQNKTPFLELRMRNTQGSLIDDLTVKKQDVEVNDT